MNKHLADNNQIEIEYPCNKMVNPLGFNGEKYVRKYKANKELDKQIPSGNKNSQFILLYDTKKT